MNDPKVEAAVQLMAGPRALTLEQKRRKFATEFALKDAYALYLEKPSPQLEAEMYRQLSKLAEIVAIYKYGYGTRMNLEFLPHEVAASLFTTIIMKRKHVFSWTNLCKKVVKDYVANHLRKEHYDTLPLVDLQGALARLNGDEDEGVSALDRISGEHPFEPESLVYLDELLQKTSRLLWHYLFQALSFKSYVIALLALRELVSDRPPPEARLLRGPDLIQYRLQRFYLDNILSSLRRESAFLESNL